MRDGGYWELRAAGAEWMRPRPFHPRETLVHGAANPDERSPDGRHRVRGQGTRHRPREDRQASQLLGLIGLTPRGYQENRRTSYTLGPARLEIDAWPRIPPYLEIEADDADQVWETAAVLGIDRDRLTSVNTTKVYALYGIDLDAIADLRFP
ncbi:adenylate cyclase [Streptomyces albidoflavus]|uniref:adenylate cyclase n=1 Tax=Streptomyces albidoflavus TaxID=1886 RepID=UPI0021B0F783|nr:adenylate cyclase [Streptomyces albidoflavus]